MAEEKVINSTKTVNQAKTLSDAELNAQIKALGATFAKEKKVAVTIAPHFQRHVGGTWFLGINGVSLNIPVDGKKYEIPESFANVLHNAMNSLTT